MEFRSLGQSGIEASAVAFGAWAIGGWMWGGADDDDAVRAIHAALDAGINFVDTAPVYGFGRSEEVVGRVLRDRRDEVVLATKCGLIWHEARGEFNFTSGEDSIHDGDSISVYRCLAPDTIRYEVEQSLRRLGTDRIDLLQTHWQEPTTPIEDTMAALLDLKQEGKIRAIGCSNATTKQMDEYAAVGPLDSDQERFSMLDRRAEAENLRYCEKNGLAFLAYSPIEQGLLTGKVGPDRVFAEGDHRKDSKRFSVENRRRVQALLAPFHDIAEGHNATLAQVAIAWTISQPGCSHALVGARTPQQARENAAAGNIALSEAELKTMDEAVREHWG